MIIRKEGAFWTAQRITGPTHNLLQLAFATKACTRVFLEDLRDGLGSLQGDDVETAVVEGVASICQALQTPVFVQRIRFCSDDSPPVEVYREMAAVLARRFVAAVEA